MNRLRQALREAVILFLVAAALGCIYTAATEKGLFARSSPANAALQPRGKGPEMITREQAWSYFSDGTALFVDTRHEFDFKIGHIRGAISIPLNDYNVKKSSLAGTPKDRLIIAYCDGAECNSSIELSVKLSIDGYKNVSIFFGGWREWVAANLPTEKSS